MLDDGLLLKTDLVVEGIHFDLSWCDAEDVVEKSRDPPTDLGLAAVVISLVPWAWRDRGLAPTQRQVADAA